jgi:hypothetical protein
MHSNTETLIRNIVGSHASKFLNGTAWLLIDSTSNGFSTAKVKKINREAGRIAYMLWARQTHIQCVILRESQVRCHEQMLGSGYSSKLC